MADDDYQRLVSFVQRDPALLSLILGGGRSKGFVTQTSDWDCYVVTADGQGGVARERLAALDLGPSIDAGVLKLHELRVYAEPGTDAEWDRYALAHAVVEVDRSNGEIEAIMAAKRRLTAKNLNRFARDRL